MIPLPNQVRVAWNITRVQSL